MADDEDEEGFGGMYENGHWVWDDTTGALLFVSDLPPVAVEALVMPTKAPTGTIEFKDDVDLIEQIRYRRRYQRKIKPGQKEVITVQDVKDIALYTAPLTLLSPALINILHLSTTDRFIRALIIYTQYYLQIADEMSKRMTELEMKVRTPDCDILEGQYRDNICDLRVLVAKEYCTMLIGGADTKKFHHMGAEKKRKSLSDKDARLFETLLRTCVQIVWLALGRIAFNTIELELNRIFKSDIFNSVEHNLKTNYVAGMSKEERSVLFGYCLRQEKKLNTKSPLMNEVTCFREVDFKMAGLGVIKCDWPSPRLLYLMRAIASPEETLMDDDMTLGIIGQFRARYDTMLKPLPNFSPEQGSKSKGAFSGSKIQTSTTKSSLNQSKKSQMSARKLYPDMNIPLKSSADAYFPMSFPSESAEVRPCSETQRRRWQNRLLRLLHPQTAAPAAKGHR